VYSFDIGQNDISLAFTANLTQERILQAVVPAIAARIGNVVKVTFCYVLSIVHHNSHCQHQNENVHHNSHCSSIA
jgi:hypothetical protein